MFGSNGNIDTLKSTIAKKGGLARQNRFNVIFTPPTQSLLNLNPEVLVGSLLSGNTPSVKNLINDPRDIALLCESVNFPSRTISTNDVALDRQVNQFPYTVIDGEVSMSFILTNDYYMKTMFDGWQSGVLDVDTFTVGYKNDYSTDVIIQQLDSNNKPIYGVKLEKAFPTVVDQIELSQEGGEYAKLSVTFSYDKYVVEGPLSSTASVLGSVADLLG